MIYYFFLRFLIQYYVSLYKRFQENGGYKTITKKSDKLQKAKMKNKTHVYFADHELIPSPTEDI